MWNILKKHMLIKNVVVEKKLKITSLLKMRYMKRNRVLGNRDKKLCLKGRDRDRVRKQTRQI